METAKMLFIEDIHEGALVECSHCNGTAYVSQDVMLMVCPSCGIPLKYPDGASW